jgi:hypothetical protein
MVFSRRQQGAAIAAATLASAVLLSAQANAQPPEAIQNGVACVYEKLTANRGFEVVAEVFLRDDVPENLIPQAASILDIATQGCAETHGWSISRTASASDVGLYGATIDFLLGRIGQAGAAEASVEKFRVAVAAMSSADYAAFAEADWRSDLVFTHRLRGIALEAGLPDTDEVMDMALEALELGARSDYSVSLFLLDLVHSETPPA